ncbi:DUF2695 domain-containing protein [Geodermatophilus sp. SYSU D00815]
MTTIPGECVLCFVDRMLTAFGRDRTLRWAVRRRDSRAPRATGLEGRLRARGGCCDCEVFANGWDLARELRTTDEDGRPGWPAVRPPCVGARGAQPCDNWVALGRGGW